MRCAWFPVLSVGEGAQPCPPLDPAADGDDAGSCRLGGGTIALDLDVFCAFANLRRVVSGLDTQHRIDLRAECFFDAESEIRRQRGLAVQNGRERRPASLKARGLPR